MLYCRTSYSHLQSKTLHDQLEICKTYIPVSSKRMAEYWAVGGTCLAIAGNYLAAVNSFPFSFALYALNACIPAAGVAGYFFQQKKIAAHPIPAEEIERVVGVIDKALFLTSNNEEEKAELLRIANDAFFILDSMLRQLENPKYRSEEQTNNLISVDQTDNASEWRRGLTTSPLEKWIGNLNKMLETIRGEELKNWEHKDRINPILQDFYERFADLNKALQQAPSYDSRTASQPLLTV